MFAELAWTLTATGWAAASTIAAAYFRRRLHTDQLTGLANRTALQRRARRSRHRGLIGVLLIDLDQFKTLNDTHGHDFGDTVLAAVGARLSDLAAPRELPVRLHGDEFALWLGTLTSPTRAEYRARQVSEALSVPLWIDGHRTTALGSVGLAVGPAGSPLTELLGQADQHMYQVKHARHLTVLPTDRPNRSRNQTPPDQAA